MTDQIEQLFQDLRTETVPKIIAPGSGAARQTVRRRREIRAATGSVLAVAVVAVGIGTGRNRDVDSSASSLPSSPSAVSSAGSPSGGPSIISPPPDPSLDSRFQAASEALGDPNKQPWVMATAAMMQNGDYENDINDIGEGKYRLFIFCVGPGKLSVQIKADQYGDKLLATGTVACNETPTAGRLTLTQPHSGYLRLFAHAQDGADNAAISFKFVRAD
jgi:hypothetical protein